MLYAEKHSRVLICVAMGVLCLALLCTVASATTYYVATNGNDTAVGAERTNAWLTIQHAVESIAPGDTIIVQEGSYAGAWIYQVSGTAEAWCTLKADDGAHVLLDVEGSESQTYNRKTILWIEKWSGIVSHWIVDGFEVAGASRHGIDIRVAHDIIIRNCHSHHAGTGDGIFVANSYDVTLEDNICNNNGEHGIYCADGTDRPVIRGNELYDNANCGLHFNGGYYGDFDGIITGALVERNTIHGNGATGGSAINCDGVEYSVIRNNLIYDNLAHGISLFKGNGRFASHNCDVLYNTILLPVERGSRGEGWGINISNDGSVSNRVIGNIIYNANPAEGSIHVPEAARDGFSSDYNIVTERFTTDTYPVSTVFGFYQWQGLGYDAHSMIAVPEELFISVLSNDYQLATNSPALDAGLPVVLVTNDLERLRRPQGLGYDIGSYERFTDDPIIVAAVKSPGGSISDEGAHIVGRGSNKTYILTPDPDARATAVIVDAGEPGETNAGAVAEYTFVDIQTNHTLDAYFTNTCGLTVTTSGEGLVSYEGTTTLDVGDVIVLGISADTHAHIENITINNCQMGGIVQTNRLTDLTLSWNPIGQDMAVHVDFSENIWAGGTPETWLTGFYSPTNDYEMVALLDTDGDGFKTWEEFLVGTDPTNDLSLFLIMDAGAAHGSNYVTWMGGESGSLLPFQLYRSVDLGVGWDHVSTVEKGGTGSNTWRGVPPSSGTPVFYKVTVED